MRRQQPMPSHPLLGIDRLRAVGEKIEIVGRIPDQSAQFVQRGIQRIGREHRRRQRTERAGAATAAVSSTPCA